MIFDPPLIRATLIRRYKRFLADVTLEDGSEVTAHCANPGAMLGVSAPGSTVWLEPNDNPKRKLRYSWKLIELAAGHFAGIDTSIPNIITGEALAEGRIEAVAAYNTMRAEVKYRESSRVDFLLSEPGLSDCYLEVKNVHLRREGTRAEFPDCVTARGAKHMGDLAAMVAERHRAVLLYVIQRTDCETFALAMDLDPNYAAAAAEARAAGVEMIAIATSITRQGIALTKPIPIQTG